MDFDPAGRESYSARLSRAGYVEMEAFRGRESRLGYFCFSCPYMKEDPRSPTGWWCGEVGAPDQPWGCCDLWKPFPEVERAQTR